MLQILLSCAAGRAIIGIVLVLAAALGVLVCMINETFYVREDVLIDDAD